MSIIDLKHPRARVWLGELPQARFEPSHITEHVLNGTLSPTGGSRRAAVEALRTVSTFSPYGLLGAEMTPDAAGSVRIQILTSSESGEVYTGTIFPYPERVRVGLLPELVNFVLEGVAAANEHLGGLKSGTIVFNCAAYEPVGSNGLMYRYLSNIVVQLLNSNKEGFSEEELAELFKLRLF
jgi:hypothetical protein